jgi:hypothetical protein
MALRCAWRERPIGLPCSAPSTPGSTRGPVWGVVVPCPLVQMAPTLARLLQSPEPLMAIAPTTVCVQCKSTVFAGAELCPTCRSYQAQWKNHLQYGASVAVVFIAAAGFLLWTISGIPAARKVLWGRPNLVVVSAFANTSREGPSTTSVVVVNTGDVEAHLAHVTFWMDTQPIQRSERVWIEKIVEPGKFLHQSAMPYEPRHTIVTGLSDGTWRQTLERALHNDPCFRFGFYARSGVDWDDIRTMAGTRTIRTFAAKGSAIYYTANAANEHRELRFDVVGFLWLAESCIDDSWHKALLGR